MTNVIKLSDFFNKKPDRFDEMAAHMMLAMWDNVKKSLDSLEQSKDKDVAFYAGEARRYTYLIERAMGKICDNLNVPKEQ